jgi:hypothetical protein
MHGIREGFHEKGLGQTGHTLQKTVPTCCKGDENLLNDGLLTDDSFRKGGF